MINALSSVPLSFVRQTLSVTVYMHTHTLSALPVDWLFGDFISNRHKLVLVLMSRPSFFTADPGAGNNACRSAQLGSSEVL